MTDLIPMSDRDRIALLVERVGTMDVTDAASNELAGAVLNDIVGLRKPLETRLTDLRRPHLKAADDISKVIKPVIEQLTEAEEHLRGLVGGYLLARKREAEEEEVAREEALQRAIASDPERAQEALEALMTPVERERTPDGIRLTGRWVSQVTDFKALVQAVAAGEYPLELLQPDQAALNALGRAYKESAKIPGVRVWFESGKVSVRGTR